MFAVVLVIGIHTLDTVESAADCCAGQQTAFPIQKGRERVVPDGYFNGRLIVDGTKSSKSQCRVNP